jgi:nucleoside-diphosphate-sugar epimerase
VKRVLVTGVTGRIGRVVAELLASQGVAVTGLDLVEPDDAGPGAGVAADSGPGSAGRPAAGGRVGPGADGGSGRGGAVDRLVLGSSTDPVAVADALRGVDAVVHLAAIPAPDLAAPERVFGDNAVGTFVVLHTAAELGIRRAVLASSHSVLGFAFAQPEVRPLYLPIDHGHPVQVADPYALSKQADEATGAMLARRYGMTVVALRFPLVGGIDDRLADFAVEWGRNPVAGSRELWAYLEDRDAARACVLALTAPLTGYQLVTAAYPQTLVGRDTADLLDEFFPEVPRRAPMPGRTVPWDISSAAELLGFHPEHPFPVE